MPKNDINDLKALAADINMTSSRFAYQILTEYVADIMKARAEQNRLK
ncbi:MAG: hypothetical protein LBD63_02015 [Mycoplasmataceae bacterium]|jgi:hypothetical protein|nr:hypothetical protein [Mycoplasmataceae bacterium]